MTERSPLAELASMSARVGRQRHLVQASTGNTSIKLGSTLWVKASGKWLGRAEVEDMFLPVQLGEACSDALQLVSPVEGGLTPSVETAMHLALPHRVVIHVHSVDSIAWCVLRHGPTALREILSPFRWRWIRYVPSGAALAKAIRRSLRNGPDVFILANHGLVVGAESCSAAESLLMAVQQRLAIPPRVVPLHKSDLLVDIARHTGYRVPEDELIHSLSTDPDSSRVITGGILYPCQAMFLGSSIRQLPVGAPDSLAIIDEWRVGFREANGFRSPALFLAGSGVLVASDITGSEYEMLLGLAAVAARLATRDQIRYLPRRSIQQVLSACGYRNSETNQTPYIFTRAMSVRSVA